MIVWLVKLLLIPFLFLFAGFFASLSLVIVKSKRVSNKMRERLLSAANVFSAGVFLSVGFVHLFAEGAEHLEEHEFFDIPLGYIVMPLGMLLPFFIEKVIFLEETMHKHQFTTPEEDPHEGHESRENYGHHDCSDSDSDSEDEGHRHGHGHGHGHGHEHGHGHGHGHGHAHETDHLVDKAPHHHVFVNRSNEHNILPYILMVALSAHGLIAGLAIGVQSTDSTLLATSGAIVAHKWAESFAVGVSLQRTGISSLSFVRLVIFFAAMTPTGIGLGWALSSAIKGSASEITTALIECLSAGTFIYVALFDILLHEFFCSTDKYKKSVACLVGFGVATALVTLLDDD